jgi:hypothetical protein
MSRAEVIALVWSLPLFFASIVVHELGHVVCGRLAGCVPTSCGMGIRRVFFSRSFLGTRFFLGAGGLSTAITFTLFPQLLPARWQRSLLYAGGIIGNSVVGTLALAASAHWRNSNWSAFWLLAATINLCFAVVNAVPLQIRKGSAVLSSDGAVILGAWLRRPEEPPAEVLGRADLVCALMREVGDLRGLRANMVHMADLWCALGHSERACDLLREATEIVVAPLPPHQAYEKLVRASIELAGENSDAAEAIAQEAREDFQHLNHRIGVFLADLMLTSVAERRGDRVKMAAAYDRLLANSTAIKRIQPYDALTTRLLAWRHAYLDEQGPEAVVAAYEAVPARRRTSSMDLRLYTGVARSFMRVDKHEQAAAAYTRALAAAKALDRTFRGSDGQQFRIAQYSLLDDAKTCLYKLGRAEDAARLNDFFGPIEELERRTTAEQALATQRRYGRLLRFGLVVTLFNLVAVIAAPIWLKVTVDAKKTALTPRTRVAAVDPTAPLSIWFSVTVATIFEGIFCTPLLLIGLWRPAVRRVSAVLVALLSSVGWLLGITFYVFGALLGR